MSLIRWTWPINSVPTPPDTCSFPNFQPPEHGDVKADDFVNKYNSDLANGVGNLLERSFTMMIDYRAGVLDEKNDIEEKIKNLAEKTEKNYENNFENYKLLRSLGRSFRFHQNLDRYINDEKPWALNKNKDEKLDVILNSLLFGIEKLSLGWNRLCRQKWRKLKII